MNVRRLALGLSLIGCLLAPVTSEALGLGPIDVRTSLNQPLQADIQLQGVSPGDISAITASLASPSLFSRVGIPRPDYLDTLHFKVVSSSNGTPVIRVTTTQAVHQPFLDFLLEVNWSGGRLLREYTILLNPPNYMQGHSEASSQMPTVVAPPAQAPVLGMQTSNAPPKPATRTTVMAKPSMTSSRGGIGQYRVKKGDALWDIAKSEGASTGAEINRMMVGILRANPDAFIKDNVNGLRTGYVLRIPSTSQLSSISSSAATSEVAKQNTLWRQYAMRMAGKTVAESQLKAGGSTPGTPKPANGGKTATNEGGHLRIMGTEAKSTGTSGGQMAMVDGTGKANLEHELSLAKEAAVSNQQQIDDLQSRINALQGIVSKQQKLLELKNQELATLQAKLGHAGTANNQPAMAMMPAPTTAQHPVTQAATMPHAATSATPSTAAMPATTTAAKPASATEAQPKVKHATPPAKPEVKHAVPPAKPTPPKPQSSGSIVDMVLDNPNYLMAVGGLALLLLVLLWLIVRRSGKAKQAPVVRGLDPSLGDGPSIGGEKGSSVESSTALAGAVVAGAAATAAVAATAHADEGEGQQHEDELSDLTDFDDAEPLTGDEPSAATDDAMAEADVYIAYGLYPQAEAVIQKAIEDEPDNHDYRAKLLECHYAAKDKDAFDREAKGLLDDLGNNQQDPVWQRVAALGKSLNPDNPLYMGADTSGLNADDIVGAKSDLSDLDLGEADDLDDMDVELGDDGVDAKSTAAVQDDDEVFDLGELDLGDDENAFDDLDFGDPNTHEEAIAEPAADSPAQTEPTAAEDDSLTSLDFSMDDLDLPSLDEHEEEPATATSSEPDDLGLDFESMDIAAAPEESVSSQAEAQVSPDDLESLDFDLDLGSEVPKSSEPPVATTDVLSEPKSPEETTVTATAELDTLPSDGDLDNLDDIGDLEDLEFDVNDIESESATEGGSLITDGDEVATKLDLAKAYIDMGDEEGAQSTLQEVMAEGSPEQREEAEALLKQMS
ncbi:hypothetical protein BJI67_10150 [Acidihalobacter aeolianus]|uniref:GAT domain-containing protein n=1 Tax=Acidihalobacter aeolianus TaxID=2792603 RepID=A0A1D8K8U2_9GAMM|nr:FimV/HubP family polar landmark protein [Acidihalobacter aeolianus]AOV17370.1 hypothetical protein BJI67_10150 [Acidihalobacter aeolianus]